MSGGLSAEPDIINKVYCDEGDKESIVNIYVSEESLRVYDNPWVEDTSPNTPGPPQTQHPVKENSGKWNPVRSDSVLLVVICLLLVAGIIFLEIQMKTNKANWERERDQLLKDNANLRRISDQLTANNTELSGERDQLWSRFCRQQPKKCKNLDD